MTTTDTDTLSLGQKKAMQISPVATKRNPYLPLTYQEKLIEKLEKMVREHLPERYSITLLATHVAMSNSSLYRFLKKMTGSSPGQFIRNIRLQEAVFYWKVNSIKRSRK